MYLKDVFHSPWISNIHNTLNSLGLSCYWQAQFVDQPLVFKKRCIGILKDQYYQHWYENIFDSGSCLNYRIFKADIKLEHYFTKLPFNLAIQLFKFRCVNHKLPIEKGRHLHNYRPSTKIM